MRRTSRCSPRTSFPAPIASMRRRVPRRGFRPDVSLLEDRALLATVTWVNPAGGNWVTPSNWSTGAVPGRGDDAQIDVPDITVSVSGSDAVNSVTSQASIDVSGTLSIASASTISGLLSLDSGSTLNGSGTIDADGGLAIDTSSSTVTLSGVTLDNDASATWTGTGNIVLLQGTVINNQSGATFALESDATMANSDDSAVVFNNAGSVVKSAGTTSPGSNLFVAFNNSGSVLVQQGALSVGGGPSLGTSSGTCTGDAGTVLGVVNMNLSSTSVISGDTVNLENVDSAGSVSVVGTADFHGISLTGSVSLGTSLVISEPVTLAPATSGPLTVGQLLIESNTSLTGPVDLVVTGSTSIQSGGALSDLTLEARGGLTIDTSSNVVTLSGVTLDNDASATWTGTGNIVLLQGTVINNQSDATFDLESDATMANSDNSAVVFNNTGSVVKSAGTTSPGSNLFVAFNNSGSVLLQHGSLNLSTAFNAGTVTVASGTSLDSNTYTQTAGATILNGGTLNGGTYSISAGALTGTGTINASVTSSGRVIPGGNGAAGLLQINGTYNQTASGALDIGIGGTSADTQYAQLAVSGDATLGGMVNVSLINAFQPALGNTFQPLTFASFMGTFGFYNGIVLGNRLLLDPEVNPTNLTLTVQPDETTTTLAAPPSPSVSGQSVTFTAAVSIALPPTTIDPVPTGTVTFYNNGKSIGTGTLGVVSGQDQASLTIATLSTASHSITAAYTSGDTNFIPSPTSTAVTPVVNKANTSMAVATSGSPSVYGQFVMFTATVSAVSPGSTAVAYPTGTVIFYDGGTSIGTGTLSVVSGQDEATISTSALSAATHSITAAYTSGDGSFNASATSTAINQVVNKDSSTASVSASPSSANLGQTVTFTATVTANSPGSGTPTGTVDFYDTTTSTDLTPGGVSLSSGTAAFSTTSLAAGPHTIKATYSGDPNFLTSYGTADTVTVGQSIVVLDPSAGGALSLSGNASINLPGGVCVNSSSSSALSASGNAAIKASVIDVHGGVQKSGNASFSPAPVTGAASLPDPLAGLPVPVASNLGITSKGSLSLSGSSSQTIVPGVYSQISASGNAKLTLDPGIYVITGGGFTVSGNASVAVSGPTSSLTGTGVMIYNAGTGYNLASGADGGTFGAVTLSGNGTYSLSPPTTGTYAGVVIFQSRENSKALTISGNASGMTGTIYAPAASLAESGNASLNAALIVDTLSISGNGVSNTVTLSSPSGTVAYTPAQIRTAYGVNSVAFDGSGQIIAIVDAYDDPSIDQALDAFDSQFGLTASGPTLYSQYGPASSFLTVLNQYGQATSLPSTDPNGAGSDNWEVEEALDVEWAHAIAPGAQIILIEANSQSLSDLMASVATAASQPGVSVVSMSWGFAEGQAVFASDEATYDSVFTTPGVTFVASTGDYGAADPEYPAYSPNVVAVGGTSLTLNSDNSYNSETGWGYYSDSVGAFIASGGGISLYEPEPAYQLGVQSTGSRTTPDVSLVADPATGAWIADPYNLDPSNSFEIVGGTSLSAPAWAGLVALVNQGRAAAGESSLNSSSPTDTLQALYMLPQSDYNVIASGTNGYFAAAGYNLVTGLGTPVANLLVPDLIAYQGSGTTYSGPGVAPLQSAGLVNTGTSDGGVIDVFSVFDALPQSGEGLCYVQNPGHVSVPVSSIDKTHVSDLSSRPASTQNQRIIRPSPTPASLRQLARAVSVSADPPQSNSGLLALDAALLGWSRKSQVAVSAGPNVSACSRGVSLVASGGPRITVLRAKLVDATSGSLVWKRFYESWEA